MQGRCRKGGNGKEGGGGHTTIVFRNDAAWCGNLFNYSTPSAEDTATTIMRMGRGKESASPLLWTLPPTLSLFRHPPRPSHPIPPSYSAVPPHTSYIINTFIPQIIQTLRVNAIISHVNMLMKGPNEGPK